MQMKVPYPNNTEDNTIINDQKIFYLQYSLFIIHRMILGEQICA